MRHSTAALTTSSLEALLEYTSSVRICGEQDEGERLQKNDGGDWKRHSCRPLLIKDVGSLVHLFLIADF